MLKIDFLVLSVYGKSLRKVSIKMSHVCFDTLLTIIIVLCCIGSLIGGSILIWISVGSNTCVDWRNQELLCLYNTTQCPICTCQSLTSNYYQCLPLPAKTIDPVFFTTGVILLIAFISTTIIMSYAVIKKFCCPQTVTGRPYVD